MTRPARIGIGHAHARAVQGPHLRRDAAAARRAPASTSPRTRRHSRKLILGTNDAATCAWSSCAPPTCRPTCSTAAPTSASPARDMLLEHGGEGLYQPLDLGIARCRMMRRGARRLRLRRARCAQGSRLRVATKYVDIAREHFAAKGVHVDLIKLYGSMELAPLTGLADAIVDLVSTGSTLQGQQPGRGRGDHARSRARLVVNQAALKLKREPICSRCIDAFATARRRRMTMLPIRRLDTADAGLRRRSSRRCSRSRRAETDARSSSAVARDPRRRARARRRGGARVHAAASTASSASGRRRSSSRRPNCSAALDALPAAQRDALRAAAARIRAYPRAPEQAAAVAGSYTRRRRHACSARR